MVQLVGFSLTCVPVTAKGRRGGPAVFVITKIYPHMNLDREVAATFTPLHGF